MKKRKLTLFEIVDILNYLRSPEDCKDESDKERIKAVQEKLFKMKEEAEK